MKQHPHARGGLRGAYTNPQASEVKIMEKRTFDAYKAERDNALNVLGLSNERMEGDLEKTVNLVGKFSQNVLEAATRQAVYHLLTNIPCNVIEPWEDIPASALRTGIVNALGKHIQWDIGGALSLCADILDDVNAHKIAATLREMKWEDA